MAFAGSQGNFELNAVGPTTINNFLHSARILGDACDKFRRFSVEGGVRLNRTHGDEIFSGSLMLVTALSPMIGYEKAFAIAHSRSPARPVQESGCVPERAGRFLPLAGFLFCIVSMAALASHRDHGIRSAFQTLGVPPATRGH